MSLSMPHLQYQQSFFGQYGDFIAQIASAIGQVSFLGDFNGLNSDAFTKLQTDIKGLTKGDTVGFWNLINVFGEAAFKFTGTLSLNLNSLTKGVLPDLSANLASADMLIVVGGGNTGLAPGLYYNISKASADDVIDTFLSSVIDHLSGVFSGLNITFPTKGDNVQMSFFIQKAYFGIRFILADTIFQCIVKEGRMSCQVDSAFISFVENAGQWLVSKAAYAWDEAQKTLMSLATDAYDTFKSDSEELATNAQSILSTVEKEIEADYKNFVSNVRTAIAVADAAGQAVKAGMQTIGASIITTFCKIFGC